MKTLALFSRPDSAIPASTAWYLDTLGEFRGKQELYTHQSPQKLKVLREHALIESAVSSNRIEGVSLEASRIQSVLVATKPLFRDRDEEEIRGYRDALGSLCQPGKIDRAEQGSLLRNTGTVLFPVARRQTRPVAFHQLHPQHSQERLSGV
jgi:hypothetical protein